jgi:zinc ribbon protein
MKLFNARTATEEYMSTHSLTFSTPEMTLKKFALWLGEQVTSPDSHETVPRLTLFLQEKKSDPLSENTEPDIDDTFRPSGAVTEMYGTGISNIGGDDKPGVRQVEEGKHCINCGANLSLNSKFCKSCGTKQA